MRRAFILKSRGLDRRGFLPLWMAVVLASLLVVVLVIWTVRSMSDETADGRQTIVFWNAQMMGEEIYALINQFETLPENRDPTTGKSKYRVVLGSATSPDITGDAQRLLCAVAGNVPPDVVWFDRFAIGEWAGRGALQNLLPYIQSQPPDEPNRLNLDEFYAWAIAETSYRTPGSNDEPGIFGIPTNVDLRVLFCNSNLLRQEGLIDPATREPRPPRTWEELRSYGKALTRFKKPNDRGSGIARIGFAPNMGDSWLYMFAWQAGAEFLSPDRTRITLDSPRSVRALRYMVDLYDDAGGYKQAVAFEQSATAVGGELDAFIREEVAIKIDGSWYLTNLGDWRRDMDFTVTPAPMPADRMAAGAQPVTWGGGFALVMPSSAHNKTGAWKLIQFLSSKSAMLQLEESRREAKQSQGRLYLARTMANRVVFEELVRRHVDGNPAVPATFKRAYAVFKEMMPRTLYRPVTPVGQVLWNQHKIAYEDGANHILREQAHADVAAGRADYPDPPDQEMHLALSRAEKPVQRMLDQLLTPLPPQTQVRWSGWLWLYVALISVPLIALVSSRRRSDVGTALLFTAPWSIGFIVLIGGPIFFSILYSFMRYDVLNAAHWIGFDNFRQLLGDPLFYKSLANTVFMMIRIPLTMAASLAIAVLLNRGIRGIGFYRTACYMPAIVPAVAASLLWLLIFNPNRGFLNQSLQWLFDLLNLRLSPPLWLQDERWSKPSLILMSLWSAGGGIIIWLAGLQSIPQQLYEAASIDGASPWRRFWNVTVPMLSPYILFNFIVGVIGTMQIFNEAFVMTQGKPGDSTLFYAYHLFREAFQYFRMGYASALAWILFVIVLSLTLLQLWLSKRWVHYERS